MICLLQVSLAYKIQEYQMFVKIRVSSLKFGFLKYELLMLFCCFCNHVNKNKQTKKEVLPSFNIGEQVALQGTSKSLVLKTNVTKYSYSEIFQRNISSLGIGFVTTAGASAIWKILSATQT